MRRALELCSNEEGYRAYRQSLLLVFIAALDRVMPDTRFNVRQSVNRSTYVEFTDGVLEERAIEKIKGKMRELIENDFPLKTITVSKKEAKELFEQTGKKEDYEKIMFTPRDELILFFDANKYYSVYGRIFESAGALTLFDIIPFESGLVLRYPHPNYGGEFPPFVAGKKIIQTIDEYRTWNTTIGISDVFELNRKISEGKVKEIINLSEIIHEKSVAGIADTIKNDILNKKVILISGPSSSGKTTFANRLMLHLRVNGITPQVISLDDYFLDREQAPLDEFGKPNFEDLDSLDYTLFSRHINALVAGRQVDIPKYDFGEGKRSDKSRTIRLDTGSVVIVEGIHALNEKLSAGLHSSNLYKVYCSALTSLSFDDFNPISPTDTRLLRRIIRDQSFRGCGAVRTLGMWDSVSRGEIKNIFPYENNVDVIFNSSNVYEFSIYRNIATPLLEQANEELGGDARCERLLGLLSFFEELSDKYVPPMSILREFIGNSSISY